jgi:small subunit ribosomal protein S14
MARLGLINNNKKRVALAQKSLKKRAALKETIYNKDLPMEERFVAIQKLSKLPRNSAMVRVRRRCEITGRPRGNYRFFGMCRNMLRDLASSGKLPGVIKASW